MPPSLPPARRSSPEARRRPRRSDLDRARRRLALARGADAGTTARAALGFAQAAILRRREFEALVFSGRAVAAMDAARDAAGAVEARLDRAAALSLLRDVERLAAALDEVTPRLDALGAVARVRLRRRLLRLRSDLLATRGRPAEAVALLEASFDDGLPVGEEERRRAWCLASDARLAVGDFDGCERLLVRAASVGPSDDARGMRVRARLVRVAVCRDEEVAVHAASSLLDDLQSERTRGAGPAARREVAILVAEALGTSALALPVARRAYDLAAGCAFERLVELARCVAEMPETAAPSLEDLAILEDHRRRMLDGQAETYAAVARLLAAAPRDGRSPARALRAEGELTCVCAWCQRVRARGVWLSIQQFLPLQLEGPIALTHGICDACAPGLRRQLDAAV